MLIIPEKREQHLPPKARVASEGWIPSPRPVPEPITVSRDMGPLGSLTWSHPHPLMEVRSE